MAFSCLTVWQRKEGKSLTDFRQSPLLRCVYLCVFLYCSWAIVIFVSYFYILPARRSSKKLLNIVRSLISRSFSYQQYWNYNPIGERNIQHNDRGAADDDDDDNDDDDDDDDDDHHHHHRHECWTSTGVGWVVFCFWLLHRPRSRTRRDDLNLLGCEPKISPTSSIQQNTITHSFTDAGMSAKCSSSIYPTTPSSSTLLHILILLKSRQRVKIWTKILWRIIDKESRS